MKKLIKIRQQDGTETELNLVITNNAVNKFHSITDGDRDFVQSLERAKYVKPEEQINVIKYAPAILSIENGSRVMDDPVDNVCWVIKKDQFDDASFVVVTVHERRNADDTARRVYLPNISI